MKNFNDKVAIVTGASSGIGRSVAIEIAKRGASVAVVARREDEGIATVREIQDNGGNAKFIRADLTQAGDVEAMVKQTLDHFGKINYAFNNAGTGELPAKLTDLAEEEFDRTMNINVKGTWLCMKYQIPELLKQEGGAIVNMASVFGTKASELGVSAYIASKHAVVGMTKAAALEFASQGLRVNCVSPAWVPTEANAPVLQNPELKNSIIAQHPIGRLGTHQDIANAVMWMLSEDAAWYTAQNLIMDGGFSEK